MVEREQAGKKAQSFFDELWKQGDYWQLETSDFERDKYAWEMNFLQDRRYQRVLEIGCGSGTFTRLLAGLSDDVLALDVSTAAIERARQSGAASTTVEFRVGNIMESEIAGDAPWDLVVMNETVYYLGWLYSFFDVAWLASRVFAATREQGRFFMANTFGESAGYLLHESLIKTYRDLFINVGFEVEREEIFRGDKESVPLEVLMTLFRKPADEPHGT